MTLRIEQDERYTGHDRWSWAVWIDGTADELNRIESVTYYLHSTFPDPVRVIKDRRSKFRLDSAGWGTFEIKAEIRFKDGKVVRRSHNLKLHYPDRDVETEPVRAGEQSPTVFIASSVADRPVVSLLREALAEVGVNLIGDSDVDPGLPWQLAIERALSSIDAVVALVSDVSSPSVESEMQTARDMEIPVLPVQVGKGRGVPQSVSKVQTVRLKGPSDVNRVAAQLAKGIQALMENTPD